MQILPLGMTFYLQLDHLAPASLRPWWISGLDGCGPVGRKVSHVPEKRHLASPPILLEFHQCHCVPLLLPRGPGLGRSRVLFLR